MHIIMPGYCLQYTTHQGKKQPLQYYKINLTGHLKCRIFPLSTCCGDGLGVYICKAMTTLSYSMY